MIKVKGVAGKHKMDPIDSCLCKKAITGLVHLKLPEKHYMLYTKQGGLHKRLNMHDCCYFNKDGTWIKKNIDAGRPQSKEKWWDDVNFAQISILSLEKYSVPWPIKHANTRNIMQMIWIETITRTTVLDVTCQIAWRCTYLYKSYTILLK